MSTIAAFLVWYVAGCLLGSVVGVSLGVFLFLCVFEPFMNWVNFR